MPRICGRSGAHRADCAAAPCYRSPYARRNAEPLFAGASDADCRDVPVFPGRRPFHDAHGRADRRPADPLKKPDAADCHRPGDGRADHRGRAGFAGVGYAGARRARSCADLRRGGGGGPVFGSGSAAHCLPPESALVSCGLLWPGLPAGRLCPAGFLACGL